MLLDVEHCCLVNTAGEALPTLSPSLGVCAPGAQTGLGGPAQAACPPQPPSGPPRIPDYSVPFPNLQFVPIGCAQLIYFKRRFLLP